jgi:two-component system sensor histidine kinase KdpD
VLLESGEQLALAAASGGAQLSPADLSAAGWALGARLPVRGGAYPAGEATFDFWPVASPGRQRAVLGLAISGAEASRPDHPEHQVEQVGAHLGLALDRAAYAAQALEHRVAMESQRLKGDLLAAVSHDLKTPLSTILFTLQSLQRFDGAHDPADRAELLAGAETEAQRLSRMVSGLLDMNRLDAGAVPVQLAPLAPADLAAVALDRAAAALSGRSVLVQVPADAPLLLADAALAETALANLLENAGKYAPAGSTVRLRLAGPGLIEVLDEGPGLGGEALRLLEPFVRGVEGDGRPPGMGLGLALARGFAEAQGGALELADRLEGGAVARLRLPLAEARVPA